MSNAVQVLKDAQFTPEQMKLITSTIAKDATPDELKLFLYRAQNMGLDPLKPGMIHFVKYGNGPGAIVVGIEGFRSFAARTGKMAGIKRGVIKDEKGKLTGAWCEVYRHDWKEPAREEVPLAEYNTGRGPWAKMPETMIKKVAEAATLRMAFPDDLGGVYEKAEMDQVEANEKLTVSPTKMQPDPNGGDGHSDSFEYRIPGGGWKGRSIEEVYREKGPEEIMRYIKNLESPAYQKKYGPLKDYQRDMIERLAAYVGEQENKAVAEMKGEEVEEAF